MSSSVQNFTFSNFLQQLINHSSTADVAESSSVSKSDSHQTIEKIRDIYIRNVDCLKLNDDKQKTTNSVTEVISEDTLKECSDVNNFKSFISTISKIENLNIFNTKEDGYNPSILQRALDSGEKEDAIISLLEGGFLFNPDEIKADLLKRFSDLGYLTAFELVLKSHTESIEGFLKEPKSIGALLQAFEKDKNGNTALNHFCQYSTANQLKAFVNTVKTVINASQELPDAEAQLNRLKEFLNAKNKGNRTPLMVMGLNELATPDVIEMMIQAGSDIFAKDEHGNTVLHYFCRKGNKDQLKAFLDAAKTVINANPNLSDAEAQLNRLKEFLNAQNKAGMTHLMFMSYNKSATSEMIEFMIQEGSDIFVADEKGNTVLHRFCENSTADQLKAFLDAAKAVINVDSELPDAEAKSNRFKEFLNAQNKSRMTSLIAMSHNKTATPEMIEFVIEAGADIFAKDEDGDTALHCFSEQSTAEQLQAFIDAAKTVINASQELPDAEAKLNRIKEFLNAQNKRKKTPLMSMNINKTATPQMIKAMIQAGADIFAKDEDGDTALHCFSEQSTAEQLQAFIDAAKEVIEANSDLTDQEAKSNHFKEFINDKNNFGETSLMSVVSSLESLSSKKIKILCDNQARVNEQDNEGNTALMVAVETAKDDKDDNYLEYWENLIRPLIRWGANPSIKNRINKTARDLVQKGTQLWNLLNSIRGTSG